ncbi:hypothetical protein HFO89_08645 [Rhizobium leguminosarum]|uniref:hypothetical protein n=1 Tax=Rhizobium leguminosarum TaxID=384 RepID=UPI001C9823B6|nr:hypothetical protein [Rhizobium leguminosarum]MBY5456424.1 hypothetical protein [Rhizobium leguminosarum]
MIDRALYYPYIHIRDVEWLKATLLLFSQVRRMTPVVGRQPDDGPIAAFTKWLPDREPLVFSTDLHSARAIVAQTELAQHIRSSAVDMGFRRRFGRDAADLPRVGGRGFQIHQAKLDGGLKDALRDTGLAWEPGNPEPWLEYVELHPSLGEAIMSTLAIACAVGEGLDIVGDERSGLLHVCLTERRPEDVYNAWLNSNGRLADPRKPNARELFEFVVTVACDTTRLTANALAKMGENREPIRRLMRALAERAEDMVALDPGKDRTTQFYDETSRILRAWEGDRANMQQFWRKFFGVGLIDPGGSFLENVVGKALETAPTAATAATGAFAGLALQGPLLSAGAGLGIGLFVHGAQTFSEIRTTTRESPYKYLTMMEKAGAVIRTDLRRASYASVDD